MNENLKTVIHNLIEEQKNFNQVNWDNPTAHSQFNLKDYLEKKSVLSPKDKERVWNELQEYGPISHLVKDPSISEILINQHNQIYFEKNGQLFQLDDCFYSETTYQQFVERLCQMCTTFINKEKPFVETEWNHMRLTIVLGSLGRGSPIISIRKKTLIQQSLTTLRENDWANDFQLSLLKSILKNRFNFIVVGGTSSGKTTALQALINELPTDERMILIEDTPELNPPNTVSTSLLTQPSSSSSVPAVSMSDLLKRALRLRPDRIGIGEIRGGEACDLLMALSTGHSGSFGSLHAKSPHEALLRLEMLVQMGAPHWSIDSIRTLIGLTIQYIIVVEKKGSERKLAGIYKLETVEKTGFTISRKDEKDY